MSDQSSPIELEVTSANPKTLKKQALRTFSSYNFDVNLLAPASPFRFTAEGVDRELRQSIRSGDLVELFIRNSKGQVFSLATGFIDETDTHITPSAVSYLLTGRDTLGQLVDNAAVDRSNRIIHLENISLKGIAEQIRENTRVPAQIQFQDVPNGRFLFQTNPGETKINALQRYLEYANCLAWSLPNGQMVVGKPSMKSQPQGTLRLSYTAPEKNNCLEARSRRNLNLAIRQIAVQLQALSITDPAPNTVDNADKDVKALQASGVGKSIYRLFSQGNGMDGVNQLIGVGKNFSPQEIGQTLARREIAHSNMGVLEVEAVVRGHTNERGNPYLVDQVYSVFIEDDGVAENMYVCAAKYDMTKERGRTTTLKLVRLGTIVADVPVR
jgi:prophage tail gpP-like protein